ncbi:MAG TPA: hypothetical protein VHA76_04920, partial [Solirubrobacterales bacterium]|nr:hypothetical protein [Solirubrobacterales bacterium]
MKSRFIASAAVLGVVGVVALAGCGGGSSSSSASGSTSSGDFAGGADAACTTANKQIAALGTPHQSEVLHYMETTESVIETLQQEVAALGASGAAKKAYTQALGKAVITLNQMTNAARNENFDAVREISDELIELHLGELAEKAKLTVCAEVPVS